MCLPLHTARENQEWLGLGLPSEPATSAAVWESRDLWHIALGVRKTSVQTNGCVLMDSFKLPAKLWRLTPVILTEG